MPEIFTLAAAAALAASGQSPAGVATAAGEPARPEAVKARHEVCYALAAGPAYPALDLAGCLSLEAAPEAAFWTQVCGFLRESEQLEDYQLASYSDCIRQRLIR